MARLALSLLGPFEVTLDGTTVTAPISTKGRALLAYLALESGRPHRRDVLAGLLWPDYPERSARTNLRNTLSDLRAAIGDRDAAAPFLLATRDTIQFSAESDPSLGSGQALSPGSGRAFWLDVTAFRSAVKAEAPSRLEEVVALYRGPFLEDLSVDDSTSYEEWTRPLREELERHVLEALQRLAAQYEERGDMPRALESAWRLVDLAPWREEGHRTVMRLLALSGQRSAALAQYETCRRLLHQELDVAPSAETTRLYERIQAGMFGGRAEATAPQPIHHNLPVQLTPFVGRELVLAQIGERLREPDCRLLTLVGPGGIGKTRLALEAARREVGRYEDGVYWVALAPLRSADTMVSAVAQAVGFSLAGGGDPWQRLLDYLRPRQMLLVLDNLEHLLDIVHPAGRGAADLVNDILRAAPAVKVVVTSRATLNVQSEYLLPIWGMGYPAPDGCTSPHALSLLRSEEVLRFSAVQLFLATSQRVRPGFEPTAGELADVAQTCRLVGGMPLAILLAAAWMEMLSPAEILAELEQGYGLLEGDLRDLPERQQSVEAVFDASWQMLDDAERETFARLSVFRGGFEREAAQEVAGASLRTLMSLVRKSFLQRDAPGRYEVHELLRQYAEHKLAEDPAMLERTADLHCNHYAEVLRRGWADADRGAGAQGLLPEIDNLRAGWHWAVSQTRYAEICRYIDLFHFVDIVGWNQEAITSLEWAIHVLRTRSADEIDRERCVAFGLILICQGRAFQTVGSGEESEKSLREGVSILRRLGARRELAQVALRAAWVMAPICDAEARAILEESIAFYREQGDFKGMSELLPALGELAVRQGAYNEAERYCQEAIRLGKQIDHSATIIYASIVLAKVAYYRGEYEFARQLFEGAVASWGDRGYRADLGWLCARLGDTALAMGDYEGARAFYRRAWALHEETDICWIEAASGEHYGMVYELDRLAEIALAEGHLGQARELYGQALSIAREHPQVTLHLDVVVSQAALLAHKGRGERAVELAALALHHPRSHVEVTKRAQKLLEDLETVLPPDVYTTVRERGRARDLEETVKELLADWA